MKWVNETIRRSLVALNLVIMTELEYNAKYGKISGVVKVVKL